MPDKPDALVAADTGGRSEIIGCCVFLHSSSSRRACDCCERWSKRLLRSNLMYSIIENNCSREYVEPRVNKTANVVNLFSVSKNVSELS